MPGTITTVRQRLALLKRPIATLNNVGQDIESTLSGTDESSGKTAVVVSGGGFLRWLVGTLADFGTTLAATLMLAVFLLAAMDSLRYKLVSVLPEMSGKKRSLRVLHDIEHDVSRYLVTVTAINAGLGILVGGTMTAGRPRQRPGLGRDGRTAQFHSLPRGDGRYRPCGGSFAGDFSTTGPRR